MEKKNILSYEIVDLDERADVVVILDQTKLPNEVKFLHLKELKEFRQAIYLLQVRGAPAIGVFAAFALYLAAKRIEADDWETFYESLHKAKVYLNSSRPTAVNLSWALNRMEQTAVDNRNKPIPEIKALLLKEFREIRMCW